MSNINEANRIVEQAKNRRAEYIGTAVEAYALPAVLVAGLSMLLVQFSANPPAAPIHDAGPVAQVTSVER